MSDKSGVSDCFSVDNTKVINRKYIGEGFCSNFTNVGRDLASQIPDPKKPYSTYLKHRNTNSIFIRATDPFEIFKILKLLKYCLSINQKLKINSVTIALYRYYRFCESNRKICPLKKYTIYCRRISMVLETATQQPKQ